MPPTSVTEPRTRRGLDDRRSSSRAPSEGGSRSQGKGAAKEKTKEQTFMDRWVEPALAAPKPSYQDHGAAPYGVLEHMQALGEAPNARVRTRVKAEGARKSVLGRSSAAVGLDGLDTPEGSPAPVPPTPQPVELEGQQPYAMDDDRDTDYAPTTNVKKRERTTRARAVKQKSESASSETPTTAPPPAAKARSGSIPSNCKFAYDDDKIRRVVDAAKARAIELGNPDIAAAVEEVYSESLTNFQLRILLEAILSQEADAQQQAEFQIYVRAAKKKHKDAKNKGRLLPATPNGMADGARQHPPTPKVTIRSAPTPSVQSPIPSTEQPESSLSRPKISLKLTKSPSKHLSRHRSAQSNMSPSPRKRSGSAGSDSSLTSLTSNEDDDMDLDDRAVNGTEAGPSSRMSGTQGIKDHAAERGSLGVPTTAMKRSSAEAELEAERDRTLAAKKQKLNESVERDFNYQESNLRPERAAPRSRLARVKQDALPPSLRLDANGSRTASTRGSRAPSLDVDSPLSELSPAASRASTPKLWQTQPPKLTGKRAKTKQSPEKKHSSAVNGMSGAGGAGRDSPIGDDDNEELASENNDYCSACKGSGYLLCCDGCDRSFHFTCLDPPLNADAKELDEPWFCYICVAKRPVLDDSPGKPVRGLFAPLISSLKKRNPKNFELPEDLRNYFEGVATDNNGSFVEALNAAKTTRSRPGYSDDQPDYFKLRDNKGNLVQCYACGKSSQGKRPIVTCDYCSQHWHLDCLDPPLANPPALNQNGKKVHDWMCPLHADQELRRVPMALFNHHHRTIHIRRPKHAKFHETALSRGFRNNGLIELADDDTDASDSEFYEHEDDGMIYKLPAQGIKLDFIDKVKISRVQTLRDEEAFRQARMVVYGRSALEQANFARRPFKEKQVALQLAQFAHENQDLELGSDRVENLVGTLIAEAPAEVVNEMMAAEDAEKTRSASSVIPPSPPCSEQPEQLSAEQRKELRMLQELIKRKLEAGKT